MGNRFCVMLCIYTVHVCSDEDEDLARAIAASLNDKDQPKPKPKTTSVRCIHHTL